MAYHIDLSQLKDKNSCITETCLAKLDVHHCIIVIHIFFKFRENLFSDYQVMFQMDGKTDGHEQSFTPLSAVED